jgi:integrase
MTTREFWSRASRSLTPRSFKIYRRVLAPLGPGRPTRAGVLRFVDELYKGLAPATVRFRLNVLSAYLNALGIPARDLLPRRPRGEPERYVATRDDFDRMLACLDPSNPRNLQPIVCLRLLWETGCRVGELVSLPLRWSYSRQANVRTEKTGKWRTLFWSAETERAIQRWLPVRRQVARGDRLLIALNAFGVQADRLDTRTVQRLVERLRDQLRLDPKLTAHSFRHSRIHRWLANGLNTFEVQRLSGHANAAGLEHYTRYGGDHNRRAAERAM